VEVAGSLGRAKNPPTRTHRSDTMRVTNMCSLPRPRPAGGLRPERLQHDDQSRRNDHQPEPPTPMSVDPLHARNGRRRLVCCYALFMPPYRVGRQRDHHGRTRRRTSRDRSCRRAGAPAGPITRAEAAFDPLPFDGEAARAYGRIYAAEVASGRKGAGHSGIGSPDCGNSLCGTPPDLHAQPGRLPKSPGARRCRRGLNGRLATNRFAQAKFVGAEGHN
jgi:hypothetical protein